MKKHLFVSLLLSVIAIPAAMAQSTTVKNPDGVTYTTTFSDGSTITTGATGEPMDPINTTAVSSTTTLNPDGYTYTTTFGDGTSTQTYASGNPVSPAPSSNTGCTPPVSTSSPGACNAGPTYSSSSYTACGAGYSGACGGSNSSACGGGYSSACGGGYSGSCSPGSGSGLSSLGGIAGTIAGIGSQIIGGLTAPGNNSTGSGNNKMRNGLPACNMDSLVYQAGPMADLIYGDEGTDDIPPYMEFTTEHRINSGFFGMENAGLTTGHTEFLPDAWGADEFLMPGGGTIPGNGGTGSGINIGIGGRNGGIGVSIGCGGITGGGGVRLGPGGLIGISGSGGACGVGGGVNIGGYNLGTFSANGCGLTGTANLPGGHSYTGTAFGGCSGCGCGGF